MSEFWGADTEQLRGYSGDLSQQAKRLNDLRYELDLVVGNETIWVGPDAENFRSEWSSSIYSMFDSVIEDMERKHKSLDEEADEQDTASDSDGDGGGGKDFFGFGDLLKMLNKGVDVFKKGKKLWDFLKKGEDVLDFAGGWGKLADKLLGKAGLPTKLLDLKPLELMKKFNVLDEVAPFMPAISKGIAKYGMPLLDVGFGAHQAYQGFSSGDTYGGISGTLGAVGGAVTLIAPFTGPAAPVVGAVGVGLSAVSAGMDLGRSVWNNREAIGNTVSAGASAVGDAIGSVGNAAGNVLSGVGNALGF